MKKQLLLLNIALFWCFGIKAQVLYNETFDSFTLGNLGTDPTGVIPGQGGWLTVGYNQYTQKNSLYTIANEVNRGKVLVTNIADLPNNTSLEVRNPNIKTLIDQRTAGNNVIKFEIDYYTGQQHTYTGTTTTYNYISLDYTRSNIYYPLFILYFRPHSSDFYVDYNTGIGYNQNGNFPQYRYNKWLKINVYLDYNNENIYFEIPYFNKIVKADFLNQTTSTNLINEFKPSHIIFGQSTHNITSRHPMVNKYNDIKITALNAVPDYIILGVNEQLAKSFNLYPNPATTVVNITNNENIGIEKVVVYDVPGKHLNTQTFNSTEQTTQLNVANLTSGTYLLHLHTKDGVAVKKIIIK